jgi:hypothetical protein
MSENGGTATATVSRNNLPVGAVLVTLTSSDTSEATVPASVLIPDGQSSVTFPITAVDDSLSDRKQTVTITATSVVYAQSTASINVLDDEGPKVLTLTPADNATGVGYKANFSLTFDTAVKKGSGNIHIVETATGWIGASIDVKSSAVVVSGSTVTIDPPINLKGLTGYSLLIDDGAFLDTSSTLTSNAVLLTETFDRLPLGPFVTEPNGDGTDFTRDLPAGFTVDNSLMPASQSDFQGWTVFDKNSWVTTSGDQDRSRFTFGTGGVAVADSDEWDDVSHAAGRFNSFLITKSIDLAGITPGSVTLEFDSSFNKELPQYGIVEVSYDDGATWSPLLFFGDANNTNSPLNNHITVSAANTAGQFVGGATVDAGLNSPASGLMKFRFGYLEGENNWWWAVDNIVVRGEKAGVPYAGIDDKASWSVTTAEAPTPTIPAMRAAFPTRPIPTCPRSAPTPRPAPAGASSRGRTSCWTGWNTPMTRPANAPSSFTAPTTPTRTSWRAKASWAAATAVSRWPIPTCRSCASGWAKAGCCSPGRKAYPSGRRAEWRMVTTSTRSGRVAYRIR